MHGKDRDAPELLPRVAVPMPVEVHLRELQTMVDEIGTQFHRALQMRGGGVPARATQEARPQQRLRQKPGHPGQPLHLHVPRTQHVVRPIVPRVERQGPRRLVVDDPAVAHLLPATPGPRVTPQRVGQREMPLGAQRVCPDGRLGQDAGREVQAVAAAMVVAGELLGDVDRGFRGFPPGPVRGGVQGQGTLKLGEGGLRLERGAQAVAAGRGRCRRGLEREGKGNAWSASHAWRMALETAQCG
ncbi:MAG: hypothetical protein HYT81_01540 [Gemmatimonadetes bacterium]|nr:hypothetical protein [Gemmatimonadota bacterium]